MDPSSLSGSAKNQGTPGDESETPEPLISGTSSRANRNEPLPPVPVPHGTPPTYRSECSFFTIRYNNSEFPSEDVRIPRIFIVVGAETAVLPTGNVSVSRQDVTYAFPDSGFVMLGDGGFYWCQYGTERSRPEPFLGRGYIKVPRGGVVTFGVRMGDYEDIISGEADQLAQTHSHPVAGTSARGESFLARVFCFTDTSSSANRDGKPPVPVPHGTPPTYPRSPKMFIVVGAKSVVFGNQSISVSGSRVTYAFPSGGYVELPIGGFYWYQYGTERGQPMRVPHNVWIHVPKGAVVTCGLNLLNYPDICWEESDQAWVLYGM